MPKKTTKAPAKEGGSKKKTKAPAKEGGSKKKTKRPKIVRKIPKPAPGSVKHKRSPISLKKFRKGTVVAWTHKSNGILKELRGVVLFTIPKNRPLKRIGKKLNKHFTVSALLEHHEGETRARQSFIVAVKDKEGRDVLYWPKLSRLEKKVSKSKAND